MINTEIITSKTMDKDLEHLSALCTKKPPQRLTESTDPDLIRLAQSLGRSISNYIPSSRTFSKPDMTIDYRFIDSDIAELTSSSALDDNKHNHYNFDNSEYTHLDNKFEYTPDLEMYSCLTTEVLQDIKNGISYACGTTYPDIDDPLVHEVITEKVKRKVHKNDAVNILSRIYPFYANNVTQFPGYASLPILYSDNRPIIWGGTKDTDGDGIVDSKDPNPYAINQFTTNSTVASADIANYDTISESVNVPSYTVAANGIVTISEDGMTVTLSQSDSAAFKDEIINCQSEEQKVVVMRTYVEKNSLIEQIITSDNSENIASLLEDAKSLAEKINNLNKISKADRFLINHLNAFVDRNSY